MMHKLSFLLLGVLIGITYSCQSQNQGFTLEDFYSENKHLDLAVEQAFNQLPEEQRVAQMLIASLGRLGKPHEEVEPLVRDRKIGGIIFLSGDPAEFKKTISTLNALNPGFPLLMSMDAEPSLFNRRMPGTPAMPATNTLNTEEAIAQAVRTIDSTLHSIGFHHNYAPVIDVSPNNEAIGNRTLGSDSATITPLALSFVHETQQDQIIATAKHFPGHGRVSGDTHKKLVYIDGDLTEVSLYKPMIDAGVLSIMVGHIAVENNADYNTNGMPATLSKTIVTRLLRDEMGFKGLIITDAMNMGAVQAIESSTLKAALAGCDLILMPPDEKGTLEAILNEMKENQAFTTQVHASVKRIIRAKLCLGMSFEG